MHLYSTKEHLFTFTVFSFIYYSLPPVFISFVICVYLSFLLPTTFLFLSLSFFFLIIPFFSLFPSLSFDLNVVMNMRAGWFDEWGKHWKSVGHFRHDPYWKPRNYVYISPKWSYKLYWSKIKLQTSPFSARHRVDGWTAVQESVSVYETDTRHLHCCMIHVHLVRRPEIPGLLLLPSRLLSAAVFDLVAKY